MGTSSSCCKALSSAAESKADAEASAPQDQPVSEFIRKLNERRESNRLKNLVRAHMRKQRVAELEEKYRCGYIDSEELAQLVKIEVHRRIVIDENKSSGQLTDEMQEEASADVEMAAHTGSNEEVGEHGAGMSSDDVADHPSQGSPSNPHLSPRVDTVAIENASHPHFVDFDAECTEDSAGHPPLQGTLSLTSGGEASQMEPSLAHCRSSLRKTSSSSLNRTGDDAGSGDRRRQVRFAPSIPADAPKRNRRSSFGPTAAVLNADPIATAPQLKPREEA